MNLGELLDNYIFAVRRAASTNSRIEHYGEFIKYLQITREKADEELGDSLTKKIEDTIFWKEKAEKELVEYKTQAEIYWEQIKKFLTLEED